MNIIKLSETSIELGYHRSIHFTKLENLFTIEIVPEGYCKKYNNGVMELFADIKDATMSYTPVLNFTRGFTRITGAVCSLSNSTVSSSTGQVSIMELTPNKLIVYRTHQSSSNMYCIVYGFWK